MRAANEVVAAQGTWGREEAERVETGKNSGRRGRGFTEQLSDLC